MNGVRSFGRLVECLRRLPGTGPKQAERAALYLFRAAAPEIEALVSALREVRDKVRLCEACFGYAEAPVCPLCRDGGRDQSLLCVVEEPSDVAAIERSRSYRGRYHVLHGALSPLEGIAPESLRIRELLARVEGARGEIVEVILATDPDTEGDATALYLGRALKAYPVKVTRIAMGIPMGGDLDYADERTLSSAMAGRRAL